MAYWAFFPVGEMGWGRIPVWGYAEVVLSRHEGFVEGERIYGYLPMSTHLVLQPDRVKDASFAEASPHRGSSACGRTGAAGRRFRPAP